MFWRARLCTASFGCGRFATGVCGAPAFGIGMLVVAGFSPVGPEAPAVLFCCAGGPFGTVDPPLPEPADDSFPSSEEELEGFFTRKTTNTTMTRETPVASNRMASVFLSSCIGGSCGRFKNFMDNLPSVDILRREKFGGLCGPRDPELRAGIDHSLVQMPRGDSYVPVYS